MPRLKHRINARNTRLQGVQSAVTYVTQNSGVTITENGIIYTGITYVTPTEIGYLDGVAGSIVAGPAAGTLLAFGSAIYAGASVGITTGLTTCSQFVGVALSNSSTSPAAIEWVRSAGAAGTVTAALVCVEPVAGGKDFTTGAGRISWMAFGT